MSFVIVAFWTVPKILFRGLEQFEIGGQSETIQTTALRSARILRRVLEIYCRLDSSERPSAKNRPYEQMVYAKPRIRPKNETYKILRNFEIQTDHLILVRWPDREITKENQQNSELYRPDRPQGKAKRKKKREIST